MLNQMRSAAKSWVAAGFIALLVVSFAVWGVSDIFSSGPRDAVAMVGDAKIAYRDYQNAFDREVENFAARAGGRFSAEDARAVGIDRQVLQRLIQETAITIEAQDLGVGASDETVARQIAQIESFRDPLTGLFSPDEYRSALARARYTPAMFEDQVRKDLSRAQLVAALVSGLRSPDILAAPRLQYMRELRRLSVVAVPADTIADPGAPTDEELEAFHQENAAAYTAPERRSVALFRITRDDLMDAVEIDADALQELYEFRKEDYAAPELRDVVELVIPSEDEVKARSVAERLRAGEEPAAVAEELGLPAPEVYAEARPRDFIDPGVADAAFATAEGAVSDPVRTPLSWSVVRVDKVDPGREATFEEIEPELREELAGDEALTNLFDKVEVFEAARDRGASLEEAAAAADAPLVEVGPFDRRGRDAAGAEIAGVSDAPILAAAFEQEKAVEGLLQEFGDDGFFALRVDAIEPSALIPLDEIKDQVRENWAQSARAKALREEIERAKSFLEEGRTPKEAAELVWGGTAQTYELRRGETAATLDRQLVAQIFAAPRGAVVIGGTDAGGAAVRVDEIVPAPKPAAAEIADTRGLVDNALNGDVQSMFMTALGERHPVTTNDALIARATGAEPPS